MRKIEQEMVSAIKTSSEWGKDNTKIRLGRFSGNIEVYLYDYHLATVDPADNVYINHKTIVDKPSKTTVSRLKALGVNAKLLGNPSCPTGVSVDGSVVTSHNDNQIARAKIATESKV